jgi:hypothetical protein
MTFQGQLGFFNRPICVQESPWWWGWLSFAHRSYENIGIFLFVYFDISEPLLLIYTKSRSREQWHCENETTYYVQSTSHSYSINGHFLFLDKRSNWPPCPWDMVSVFLPVKSGSVNQ